MKRFFTILSLGAVLLTSSCKQWLDINTNPNYIADADMALLMPTIQLSAADKLGYELTLYGSFWSQYVVQCSTTNQYYTVTNLTAGGTFLYRVKALYIDGTQSEWTDEKEVTLHENSHPF